MDDLDSQHSEVSGDGDYDDDVPVGVCSFKSRRTQFYYDT